MVNNPFTHFLGWCTHNYVTGFSWDKFTMWNVMIVSKTRKKVLTTFNMVNSEGFWYPRQPTNSAFFIRHKVKPPKKLLYLTGFIWGVERKMDVDMADFMLRWKSQGNFQHNMKCYLGLRWFLAQKCEWVHKWLITLGFNSRITTLQVTESKPILNLPLPCYRGKCLLPWRA